MATGPRLKCWCAATRTGCSTRSSASWATPRTPRTWCRNRSSTPTSRCTPSRRDSQFFTWLYRIAYNTAVSHKRKQKGTVSIDASRNGDSSAGIDPLDNSEHNQPGNALQKSEEERGIQKALEPAVARTQGRPGVQRNRRPQVRGDRRNPRGARRHGSQPLAPGTTGASRDSGEGYEIGPRTAVRGLGELPEIYAGSDSLLPPAGPEVTIKQIGEKGNQVPLSHVERTSHRASETLTWTAS